MDFFEEPHGPIPTDIVHERQDFDQVFTPALVLAPRIFNITTLCAAVRYQNALKIPISVLRKTILKLLKRQIQTEQIRELLQLLTVACESQNYSTPIKLILVAKKTDFYSAIKKQFSSKTLGHINKLSIRKRWNQQRYINTMESFRKVQRAMEAETIQQSIDCIWINNNHQGKKAESEADVAEFIQKISRI